MNEDYDATALVRAVRALSSVCDGAVREDQRGWSGADAPLGHRLAALEPQRWPARDRYRVYVALHKYRVQLRAYGLDYAQIPVPPRVEGERVMAPHPGGGPVLDLHVPYEDDLGWQLKQVVAQAAWVRERHCWEVSLAPGSGARLLSFASQHGFGVAEGVPELCRQVDARPAQGGTYHVTLEEGAWVLTCPYDAALVEAIKALPRRRFEREPAKRWYVPTLAENARPLASLIASYGLCVAPAARARLEELCADPAAPPVRPARRVACAPEGGFDLYSPFDPDFSDAFKEAVPGTERTWDKEGRRWHVVDTAEAAGHLLSFCGQHDVHVPQEVVRAVRTMEQRHKQALAASRAASGDLELPGFGTGGRQPYPFQRAGIAYACTARTCFIADEMGLGKSIQALGVLHAQGASPALIVCPASVKLNWAREVGRWLPGARAALLEGTKPTALPPATIWIANYDILYAWAPLLAKAGLRAIILDESHAIKSKGSRRTKAALALAKGVPIRLCLSGTPILNRPAELVTQLEFLGRIKDFGGGWAFLQRYTEATHNGFGWQFKGGQQLDELNRLLRAKCYVRRRKKDVLSELPPKTRADVPLLIDNRAAYEEAEEDVARWFAAEALKDEEFLASIASLSPREQAWEKHKRAQSAEVAARRAEQLLRFEALKMEAVRGKMAAAVDWIKEFLGSEEKLVVFAHHKEIQKRLLEELSDPTVLKELDMEAPAHLLAEDSPQQRQDNVDRFQTVPRCKLIVCSLIAGGIGVTLTAASNACILELGWNAATMTQAEDRLHRISQEQPVTIWYLLADDTIDDELCALIRAKQAVVDQATEGGAEAAEVRTMAELGRRLAQRRRAPQGRESA